MDRGQREARTAAATCTDHVFRQPAHQTKGGFPCNEGSWPPFTLPSPERFHRCSGDFFFEEARDAEAMR